MPGSPTPPVAPSEGRLADPAPANVFGGASPSAPADNVFGRVGTEPERGSIKLVNADGTVAVATTLDLSGLTAEQENGQTASLTGSGGTGTVTASSFRNGFSVTTDASGAPIVDVAANGPVAPLALAGPTIEWIYPSYGDVDGGTVVEAHGHGFLSGQTTVTFDGTPAAAVTVSPNGQEVYATSPAHVRGAVIMEIAVAGVTVRTGFVFIDALSIASVYAWWDADAAVDDGTGLADSIPDGNGDADRALDAFIANYAYVGLKPRIYVNDPNFNGHKSVGDKVPGATGRAFVNHAFAQGGSVGFTTPVQTPATWIIVFNAIVGPGSGYYRLNADGTANNEHYLIQEPGQTHFDVGADNAGGVSQVVQNGSGVHVLAIIYDGTNSYGFVDDPKSPVFGPSNLGTVAMTNIFTGSFFNDPTAWNWACHVSYEDHLDAASLVRFMSDYAGDRYKRDVWIRTSDAGIVQPRDGAKLVWFNGRLFFFGGWYQAPVTAWSSTQTTNETLVSDDLGETWSIVYPHTPVPPTTGAYAHFRPVHTAAWAETVEGGVRYLYKMGGDLFTPSSDTWRTSDGLDWEERSASAIWDGRFLMMGGSLNGALYVGGGQTDLSQPSTALRDFYRSRDGGKTWTRLADAPWLPRGMSEFVEWNGKLWLVAGGTYAGDPAMRTYYNDVWYFDDTDDSWHQVLANGHGQFDAREFHGTVMAGNRLWIAAGYNSNLGGNLATVYATPDGATWTEEPMTTPWSGTHAQGLTASPAGLIFAGGLHAVSADDHRVWTLAYHRAAA